MNHLPEIARIIDGALKGDTDKVRNYTRFLAQKLEKEGNMNDARLILRILEQKDNQIHAI